MRRDCSKRGSPTTPLSVLVNRSARWQREEKIVEGCEVYASALQRAKQGERTISLDELTGVQALDRKHPDLPMRPDHVLRWEFEYIRHGTLSWFINFDVVTGQVIEPSFGPTRTEEDALAHLQRLIRSDPKATKWHIMLDNLNIHQSESLVLWVAEREEIAVETLGSKAKAGFSAQWKAVPRFCMIRRIRSCFITRLSTLPG
jgi:DDE superfamily endonuclease